MSFKHFNWSEIKGFIAWSIIIGGFAYGIFITVKFVLASNGII